MRPASPFDDVLPASFFDRPTELVARELLGAVLASAVDGMLTAGRIVETEAYVGPHDPASHAAERIGRTLRNEAMHGPPGIAYVYRIYGLHWCVNAVTGREDLPAAVLIRALEPIRGQETMAVRRGRADPLASGPARLSQALGITGDHDRHPLQAPPVWIARGGRTPRPEEIVAGPRIGITRARDWPLRFHLQGNPFVSR